MSIQLVLTVIFLVLLILCVVGVFAMPWTSVCIGYLAAMAVVGVFPWK